MASENRVETIDLNNAIQSLSDGVSEADFIALVRLVECAYPELPRVGSASHLRDEALRLSQNVSLSFKGAALHSLEDSSKGVHQHRLYCNFMGLLGTNGPLPHHYTEYAMERKRHFGDETFGEFIDLFNHRLMSLLYRAIAEADPVISMDRPQSSNYVDYTAALAGLLPSEARGRSTRSDISDFAFARWLGSRSRCPDGLIALFTRTFSLPCRIKEFVGSWLSIPLSARLALTTNGEGSRLGSSSYCGEKGWSINHKFRLLVGPLSWAQLQEFAPGKKSLSVLRDLVRNYLGDEQVWDLQLNLCAGEVRRMPLSGVSRLGFDTWLTSSTEEQQSEATTILAEHQFQAGKSGFGSASASSGQRDSDHPFPDQAFPDPPFPDQPGAVPEGIINV